MPVEESGGDVGRERVEGRERSAAARGDGFGDSQCAE